jgi:hypothetical protein
MESSPRAILGTGLLTLETEAAETRVFVQHAALFPCSYIWTNQDDSRGGPHSKWLSSRPNMPMKIHDTRYLQK